MRLFYNFCLSESTLIRRKFQLSKSDLKIVLAYAAICACIFLCFLPMVCDSWVYSWYFNKNAYEKSAESTLNIKNDFRRKEAIRYISHLDAKESKRRQENRLRKSEMEMLVVVKTLDRTVMNSNPDTGYLTQTTAAIDRQIQNMGNSFRVGFIICNVDPYPHLYKEFQLLDKYYFSSIKNNKSFPVLDGDSSENKLQREKEKKDYVFCLKESAKFRSSYVLMVEDDTEPYEDIFKYLKMIILDKLERRLVRGEYFESSRLWWAFVKLYYPERWAGFGLESTQICELLAIGALTGSFFVFIIYLVSIFDCFKQFNLSQTLRLHMFLGFGFGIVLALALGRQHLMQWRRVSFASLSMTQAPGCCTPAVLYKAELVPSIVAFLEKIKCKEDYGVDLALDDFALNSSLSRYLVQPNLFHHRGVYSTLTKPKNKVEFLFDA